MNTPDTPNGRGTSPGGRDNPTMTAHTPTDPAGPPVRRWRGLARTGAAGLVLAAATAALLPLARADDDERGERGERAGRTTRAAQMPPAYKSECAACHVAYPPGLLPAASWQRLMADLPHHFGSDASLDEATTKQLAGWLTANAAAGVEAPPQDRITRTRWFQREHREVPARLWTSPAVGSPSRCQACHTSAADGVFNEHDVRLPR